MRLTKKLMKELHEELWLWLAENPKSLKEDWPRWKFQDGDIPEIIADCFACEYEDRHTHKDEYCHCPLDFPNWEITHGGSDCLNGLYDKWCDAIVKARTVLAKQIAELPIRKMR